MVMTIWFDSEILDFRLNFCSIKKLPYWQHKLIIQQTRMRQKFKISLETATNWGQKQMETSKYLLPYKQQWPKLEQNPNKTISTQSTSGPCILVHYEVRNICIIKLKCSHSNGPNQTHMNRIERYVNRYAWGRHSPKNYVGACPTFKGVKFVVFPIVDVFFYLD